MSEINPYEYLEETIDVSYAGISRSEPQLPIRMQVVHKTGFFASKQAELFVTEEYFELISPGLDEPVLIPRSSAREQIKLRLLDIILKTDDGKKYRLILPKNDPEKYLKLARLEVWFNEDSSDPDPPEVHVLKGLKKWTPCMVKNWLTCLIVLQVFGLMMFSLLFVIIQENATLYSLEFLVLLGIIAFFVTCNLTMLILLYRRQIWTLNLVTVFYVLFLLWSLLQINVIGIIIAGVVIYYASVAKKDYARLSTMVGADVGE